MLGIVVGLIMRCSDPSRHRHHQLSLTRGEDNGFQSLQQRKEFSEEQLQPSCQYQTSVFQDNRISPDLIPESFSQLNKCQEFPALLTSRPARPTQDSDSSSGFSEKAASSELSCSEYYGPGDRGLPPPVIYTAPGDGHNERNIREQSGKVFPSELEMMARLAKSPPTPDCPYSTVPR